MIAWILFYDMKHLDQKKRTKALENLFGKTKPSHKGKYVHIIKPRFRKYIRPVRAAIIVKKEDLDAAKMFFDIHKIPYRAHKIEITSTDFKNTKFF
jgi:hypothetical protein